MRVRISSPRRQQRRSGFTLIELLVVISIIATLAALILPGVQQARATARRTQCLNNLRNLGTAMQNYATDHRGELPPLSGDDLVQSGTAASFGPWGPASWSVHLLPYVEQRALYDRLLDATLRVSGESLADLASTNIEVYVCPDDPNDGSAGAMSYVVNAGYTTSNRWATNDATHRVHGYIWSDTGAAIGDPANVNVTAATGVFFHTRFTVPGVGEIDMGPDGFRNSIDKVSAGDGLSQTIFLTENLDTPDWNSAVPPVTFPAITTSGSTTWTTPGGGGGFLGYLKGDAAFAVRMLGTDATPTNYGPGGPNAAARQLIATPAGNPFSTPALQDCKINENIGTAAPGSSPRPSSLHPSVVNVMFGDGSGRNISENIDDTVYIRLVSSNGNRFGQAILSNNDY